MLTATSASGASSPGPPATLLTLTFNLWVQLEAEVLKEAENTSYRGNIVTLFQEETGQPPNK